MNSYVFHSFFSCSFFPPNSSFSFFPSIHFQQLITEIPHFKTLSQDPAWNPTTRQSLRLHTEQPLACRHAHEGLDLGRSQLRGTACPFFLALSAITPEKFGLAKNPRDRPPPCEDHPDVCSTLHCQGSFGSHHLFRSTGRKREGEKRKRLLSTLTERKRKAPSEFQKWKTVPTEVGGSFATRFQWRQNFTRCEQYSGNIFPPDTLWEPFWLWTLAGKGN